MAQDGEQTFASHHQSQQFKGDPGPSRVEKESDVDPALLLQRLSSLLKDRTAREALHDVKKDQAQLLIDYLHSVLVEEVIEPASGFHKAILFLLYKICKATLLYPRCYVLKDISHGLHEAGGGFSDIYNGQFGDQKLCLKVVRVFQKSGANTILEMYAKEAIIWGSLSHPNVVPFYGVYYWNEERRQVCLVSPWFSNGNLVEYLRQHPLTPRVPLIHDVSLGLEYLHDQGLVHGDIKGVNILVDEFERACLADLGLSSIRTDQTLLHSMHATTVSALSFRWAAPELTGESARFTVASDMWAFGCVCYEILKGELPFPSIQGDMQIIFKLITGSVPGSLDSITDIDKHEEVREVIEGCWAREPGTRPPSDQVVRKLGASLRSMESEEEQSRQRIRDFRNAMKAKDVAVDLTQIDQILSRISVLTPDRVSTPQDQHGEEGKVVVDEGDPANPAIRSPSERNSGAHAQTIAQGPARIKQNSSGSLPLSGAAGGPPLSAPFSPAASSPVPTSASTVETNGCDGDQSKNEEEMRTRRERSAAKLTEMGGIGMMPMARPPHQSHSLQSVSHCPPQVHNNFPSQTFHPTQAVHSHDILVIQRSPSQHIHIHLLLAFHPETDTPLRYDLSTGFITSHITNDDLLATATEPPLSSLVIIFSHLIWEIHVAPAPFAPSLYTLDGRVVVGEQRDYVTVYDVLRCLHHSLRQVVTPEEYDTLGPSRGAVDSAYHTRVARIDDIVKRTRDERYGIRRIDFLQGMNMFRGLSGTLVGPSVWELNVAPMMGVGGTMAPAVTIAANVASVI